MNNLQTAMLNWRVKYDLKQREAAQIAKISEATWRKAESGEKVSRLVTYKILRAVNTRNEK